MIEPVSILFGTALAVRKVGQASACHTVQNRMPVKPPST
jgi:hypothetical protein